jgi:hypothetical protein
LHWLNSENTCKRFFTVAGDFGSGTVVDWREFCTRLLSQADRRMPHAKCVFDLSGQASGAVLMRFSMVAYSSGDIKSGLIICLNTRVLLCKCLSLNGSLGLYIWVVP